jgi:hypothetical protein
MIVDTQVAIGIRDHLTQIARNKIDTTVPRLWWRDVAFEDFTTSSKEIYRFALQSAKLEPAGIHGRQTKFDDRTYLNTAVQNEYQKLGFEITEADINDEDSSKLSDAADFVADVTYDGLYVPQRLIANALIKNTKTYDGKAMFAVDHFTNGKNAKNGQFSNLIGNKPIDESVTEEVARKNFLSVISTVLSNYRDPSGKPRELSVKTILVPGTLFPRACTVTGASFGPSGTGTLDLKPLAMNLGLGKPVMAPELNAINGGSDTTWYVVCEFNSLNAPFVFSNREPFSLRTNSGDTDTELARISSIEYIYSGRVGLLNLHPFLIIKVLAGAIPT